MILYFKQKEHLERRISLVSLEIFSTLFSKYVIVKIMEYQPVFLDKLLNI